MCSQPSEENAPQLLIHSNTLPSVGRLFIFAVFSLKEYF